MDNKKKIEILQKYQSAIQDIKYGFKALNKCFEDEEARDLLNDAQLNKDCPLDKSFDEYDFGFWEDKVDETIKGLQKTIKPEEIDYMCEEYKDTDNYPYENEFDDNALYGKDGKAGIVLYGNSDYKREIYAKGEMEDKINAFFKEEIDDCYIQNKQSVICSRLSEITGKDYDCITFKGYSQGDWQVCYYPKGEISNERLNVLGDAYFGCWREYSVYDKLNENDSCSYVIYDSELNNKTEQEVLAKKIGCNVNQITIKNYRGEIIPPIKNDRSKDEGR